ncbi:hypothetical protein M9980_08080 [Sphingomonas donggukensis]|uniref:DNA binding HTH domain-containing protein n=1 Tax=Sphingomonas donggukensis TaxID=2949093 RepID=A0ABY4TQF9_9SPHN|nr:hypothetical protein [Sphingomonas donggukensis]URW74538.1 hypothetical protein M9980_08080 [Sphingomonas donggukensis]
MSRSFTRAQALQNAAFLRALRQTGNVHEAARSLGVHRSTYTKRRARDPGFAAKWDAALAVAHAALHDAGCPTAAEPRVVRTTAGRRQLRPAQPGRLTRAAEQAFLAALSATANIRLSAAAAGFSHAAFYHRRKTSLAFAREMRLALAAGYEQVEMALLAAGLPDAHADDAWRHNAPPPIPPMTANQALQLLYLQQKEARLGGAPEPLRRQRGESAAARDERLTLMAEHRRTRDREAFLVAEAQRKAKGGAAAGGDRPILPDLAQVTGGSKAQRSSADIATAPEPNHARFGGRRLGDGN